MSVSLLPNGQAMSFQPQYCVPMNSYPTHALAPNFFNSFVQANFAFQTLPAVSTGPKPLANDTPLPAGTPVLASQPSITAAPHCRWELEVVAQQQSDMLRLIELSWLDKYYHDRSTPTQVVVFRFAHDLVHEQLTRSLRLAIQKYPVIGSKVVEHNGKAMFELDAERVVVQLVNVKPEIFASISQLVELSEKLCPKSPNQQQNPLFHAFLFKSKDAKHGSVLVCGFQHCVGDAMSYAMFMREWSDCYRAVASSSPTSKANQLPPEQFGDSSVFDPNYKRNPQGPIQHSFFFSDAALKKLKSTAMRSCPKGEVLSTNDLLCAQCAVALAPSRFRQSGAMNPNADIRIIMLVDIRGIAVPHGTFGNQWTDVAVTFQWSDLLGGDVLAVARRIRAVLKAQARLMEQDWAAYSWQRAQRPPGTPKLFTWNSWAKAGDSLRDVHFSDAASSKRGLRELQWCNASWLPITDAVGVEPLACVQPARGDPRLAVRVTSWRADADTEASSLKRFWSQARYHRA